MSLAREVLRRSIQARNKSRRAQAIEDEKQRGRSVASSNQDWEDVKRSMPDAGLRSAKLQSRISLAAARERQSSLMEWRNRRGYTGGQVSELRS